MNPDVSAGPLACSFAGSPAHLFAPHCLLHSLTHSRTCGTVNDSCWDIRLFRTIVRREEEEEEKRKEEETRQRRAKMLAAKKAKEEREKKEGRKENEDGLGGGGQSIFEEAPIRRGGKISVNFTERAFPTPVRESTTDAENE